MIEIRSFRRVFDLERRIYRIDRVRLNPGGVPLRGAIYVIAAVAASLALRAVPIASTVLDAVPWYLRDLALPLLVGALLSVLSIEGRPFHVAAPALLRPRGLGTRRHGLVLARAERRWSPGSIALLPDGGGGRLRRLRYDGPGAVLVATAHRRRDVAPRPRLLAPLAPRAVLEIAPSASRGEPVREVVWLERGARLVVCADGREVVA
jgi:hypothetical protein